MRRLVCGFSISIAIAAVAELDIASRLADGPRRARDLAQATGVNEDFLRRVLRYLASEGVFQALEDDRFALTDLSHWLRADVPGSIHPRALFTGSQLNWLAWGRLPDAIKSGRSGAEEAYGARLFDYAKTNAEAGKVFNSFMVTQTQASMDALLEAYRFEGTRELVDVGGGRGGLVAAVLKTYPGLRGTLFDMPEVVASAQPVLAGVIDRCGVVGGNFFESVPAGADMYVLKFILHDWGDADCVRILSNCRKAMTDGGRVLIVEHILPPDDSPHFARFMDMVMLILTSGGRERTRREFEDLAGAAGLRLQAVASTPLGISALECVAA